MNMSLEWKDKPVKYLRDKVVDQLKFNLEKNHLEIDEFEQLVKIALSTQNKSELLSLTNDLPTKDETEIKNQELELEAYRDKDSLISILSNLKRKGNWVSPKQLRVVTVLGAAEIDFREVSFDSDFTYISLDCWFGEVNIIVPPGVNVVSNVKNIVADIDNRSQRSINPDSPTIVIEGKVIFGEFTIKQKTIKKNKDSDPNGTLDKLKNLWFRDFQ